MHRGDDPMNIHFLLAKDMIGGGGIEKYTREVGSRLAARGHSVTVYGTAHSGPRPDSLNGMRLIWIPRLRPYWAEKPCGSLLAALRSFAEPRPDILHLHSVAAGATAAILRWRGVPCIVQMHGIEWKRSRWGHTGRFTLRALERCAFHFGDSFTAVSHVECDFYQERYAVPVAYIPTAAEVKQPARPNRLAELGIKPGQYILFVSRLVPEKGAHYLIRAFRDIAMDCSLIISGAGPAGSQYVSELRRLASADPRIIFLGYVKGPLLDELFSNARIFVQPSETEGLPISLLEAMASGNICVASDIPENLEAMGDAGISFRSKDPGDLATKLLWATQYETSSSKLRLKAVERVARHFSWETVTDSLEQLYSRALQATSPTQCTSSLTASESRRS
jgi:glycosyltransferase involved in cell wall biosynthesis